MDTRHSGIRIGFWKGWKERDALALEDFKAVVENGKMGAGSRYQP
jgi:hypothetical protein